MIKSKRIAEAAWIDNRKRWQINVQREGIRKTFTSSTQGKAGKRECESKADAWLETFSTSQNYSKALVSWLEFKRQRVSEGTYICLEYSVKKHLLNKELESKKLSSVTVYDWQRIIDRIIAEGGAETSAAKMIGIIGEFISYCEMRNWEIIVPKPGQIEVPKGGKQKKVKKALSPDQVAALLALDADVVRYAQVFQLALLTGLRRGELIGLQWQDIDGNVLTIRRAVEKGVITQGKTDNARRRIPLQADALKILRDQKQRCADDGLLCQWIFPSDRGAKPMSESLINTSWKHIAGLIGAEGFTPHELRHTFISIVQGDVALSQLKQIVGHSASMDTLGVYGHTTDKDLKQAEAAVTDAFNYYKDISEQKSQKA